MLSPHYEVQDGVTVFHFGSGPHTLNEASLDELRDPMLAASRVDPPKVVVDLSQVDFFGSSFIELLFRLWKRLTDRSGRFVLAGVSPYCQEVLSVTNLDQLWETFETCEEAVAALRETE